MRALGYKYAKYKELDLARKLAIKIQLRKEGGNSDNLNMSADENLALQEEIKQAKDEWEDQKFNKDKIEVANAKRWAVYFLDACVQASRA